MTDFSCCPDCIGYPEQSEPICSTCKGSGLRQLTEANIERAVSAKEWADEQIDQLFSEWCDISGSRRAYGVSNWEIGSQLHITQDTSCMGCASTENHSFPVEWLYATGTARTALITSHIEEKRAADTQHRETSRLARLAQIKKEAAALEADILKGSAA